MNIAPATLIREAFVCLIAAADLPGLLSVHDDRSYDFAEHEIPAANVMAGGDEVSKSNDSPRQYLRRLEVMVDIFAPSDALQSAPQGRDELARLVELLLLPRLHSEGLNVDLDIDEKESHLVRVERDVDYRGAQILGAVRLVFEIAYRDIVCDADAGIYGNFETLKTTQNVGLSALDTIHPIAANQ